MGSQNAGFVVLYRWKIAPAAEAAFVSGWTKTTERMHRDHVSLGSRLHRGDDGLWYAYAQWPSEEHRRRARAADRGGAPVSAIPGVEALPEVRLEPVAGFLD